MERTYIYSGPVSGMEFKAKDGKREVRLVPGEVKLPEADPRVRRLVARGHLRLVEAAPVRTLPVAPPVRLPKASPSAETSVGTTPATKKDGE